MSETTITIDRTQPDYKVGAATFVVNGLLDEHYGELPSAARRKLHELRAVLNAEPPVTGPRCNAYGHPAGECALDAGHDGAHEMHVDVPRLTFVGVSCPTCGPVCTARENVR